MNIFSKKTFILFVMSLCFLSNNNFIFADSTCTYDKNSLESSLSSCTPKGALETKTSGGGLNLGFFSVSFSGNMGYGIDEGKNKILNIVQKILIIGSILAIGGVVFSGILFIVGLGNADKIKKAKDALKWSILGFVIMIVAQQLVNAIINLIYLLSS